MILPKHVLPDNQVSCSEIIANINHEIRTPIHHLMGLSDIMLKKWDETTELEKKQFIMHIHKASHSLKYFVDNLFYIKEFQANLRSLRKEKYNFMALLEDVIESMKLYCQIYGKEASFEKETSQDIIVDMDVPLMHQVINALYQNALQYSASPCQIIAVANTYFDAVQQENRLHFTLQDHGIGIPEDEFERIFQPFGESSRTKRKSGGKGLGLTTCRQIIEAHRGKIWAENNHHKGTLFHFTLPLI